MMCLVLIREDKYFCEEDMVAKVEIQRQKTPNIFFFIYKICVQLNPGVCVYHGCETSVRSKKALRPASILGGYTPSDSYDLHYAPKEEKEGPCENSHYYLKIPKPH